MSKINSLIPIFLMIKEHCFLLSDDAKVASRYFDKVSQKIT
jgi:hypothetical protein